MTVQPFRLRTLVALTDLLKTIQRVAGDETGPYSYNLENAVFRGRAMFGANDPLPMISILEDPKRLDGEATPAQSDASTLDWDLLIQGWVVDDPENPTDPAYYLLGDVTAKLFEAKAGTNGDKYNILGLGEKKPMIREILIGDGVIRPPDELSSTSYFWLPLRLRLVEDAANAFT